MLAAVARKMKLTVRRDLALYFLPLTAVIQTIAQALYC